MYCLNRRGIIPPYVLFLKGDNSMNMNIETSSFKDLETMHAIIFWR
jgi:hypothetical protein